MDTNQIFSDLMARITFKPKVGDEVYVGSGDSFTGGWTGGLAKIKKIEPKKSGGELQPFISVEEVPGWNFNWIYLAPKQVHLREMFGDRRAQVTADFR